MTAGDAWMQDQAAGCWWRFRAPVDTVAASRVSEVIPALQALETRVAREHLWAAGYIAYEAGPAFDPALRARAGDELPLLWFGLYPAPEAGEPPALAAESAPVVHWTPGIDRAAYDDAIAEIRRLIAAGDTYQVNYTFRLQAALGEAPERLFRRMVAANRPGCAAYLDCGRHVVCSASPELFFRLDRRSLECRPMKGTAARGLWPAQDAAAAAALQASEKDRAENVMIADMVRNDLGRIAVPGSVRVPALFSLEAYPSVWQLTSTVRCETGASVTDILRCLFPPASITGAPKVRASQIIAELESTPRGVYTGCIGWIAPGRRAQFSVAIRTAVADRVRGSVDYGVGSGIVWDSGSLSEYEECLLKARVVTAQPPPECALLETLLWEPGRGYFLLDEHLQRMAGSAALLGFVFGAAACRRRLADLASGFPPVAQRVRLLVERGGTIACEAQPLENTSGPVRLRLAPAAVDIADPYLYNKTTHRAVYEQALAGRGDCDDMLLWNARGEITETTIANIVVEIGGRRLTPPVACGLLPGVFRGHLLAAGEIEEAVISVPDLRRSTRLWTINSVRRWREALLSD